MEKRNRLCSFIGKVFGYEALQKKFAATAEKVKRNSLTERARQEIVKAMQDISTKEAFAYKLKDADIEVVYRINPEGRLYGITFIDHTIPAGQCLTARVWARPFQPMCSTNCSTIRMRTVQG